MTYRAAILTGGLALISLGATGSAFAESGTSTSSSTATTNGTSSTQTAATGTSTSDATATSAAKPVKVKKPAKPAKPEPPLKIDAELGMILNTGNTNNASAKGAITINQELARWRNEFNLDAYYSRDRTDGDDGDHVYNTTGQRLFLSGQGNYLLHPTGNVDQRRTSAFLYSSYEQDRFSGYDYQGTVAGGYTRRWISTEDQTLDLSAGPGFGFNEKDDGASAGFALVRASLNYKYKLSPTAQFSQNLSTDWALDSSENSRVHSETALKVNIYSALALKTAFTVDYNSEVDPGIKKTDTQSSVTLVYTFK
ncbi:YdiY family protein [Pokkaliibacter sp. CJK22405]|uniref:DUF481 domain-containing protein n=1 Tax=Pokkaliibacter sp. CJK22405 TaxID=3384615 RepID=UPI0039854FF5